MFVTTVIVSILLAAVLVTSARGKLVHDRTQVATISRVGFPEDKIWLLAAAEAAGAAGLLIGLVWWPLAVAAAIGIILYFLGAVGSHLRIHDWRVGAPVALLALGVAVLILRVLSV